MKKLRNIALYYIALTFLSFLASVWIGLLLFLPLLPFAAIGIFLLATYFISGKSFRQKPVCHGKDPRYVWLITLPAYFLPFLFYIFAFWYIERPYRQTVVLPKGYEGVVAIQYDQPNGQPKKWIGGFLGIGASRLIEVDSTGIAATPFTFHHNALPFIGIKQHYHNRGGLEIYYEDDLHHEIVRGADGQGRTYESEDEMYGIYFIEYRYNYNPIIIFAVINPKNYTRYFMSEREKQAWRNEEQKGSTFYVEEPLRRLREEYSHYYEF